MNELPEWLQKTICPICGKNSLLLVEVYKDIPHFGKVLLASWRCSNCGYRHVDVFSLDFKEPTRYVLKVKDVKDLHAKVIRSSSATIRIPELGVIIEPGPISQGFITNVEGVLERVENAIKSLIVLSESSDDREKCAIALRKINLARKGKFEFTLIIEDPFGISMIVPAYDGQEISIERISDDELERLKSGWIMFNVNRERSVRNKSNKLNYEN